MSDLGSIGLPDYLVVVAYFGLIVFIGYYYSRTIKMAKDYFAAGNVMPWWLAGTSFYMASFSTLLFVIYSEISYKYGFVAVTICWTGPVCILIGGYLTAHLWRRARILTPVGFMERRYNKTVHQIFVWTGFPLRMFDNALKIYSTAIVLMVAMRHRGITFNRFVILLGILMIAYTYMGGQLAVMVTDFVQAIILTVAVIVLFILTVAYVGDVGALIARLPEGFLSPVREPYDWSYVIFTVFALTLLVYNASWSLVQKYNCVRSEGDARKMVYYIALLMFLFPPVFFFPGMVAHDILPNLENSRFAYAAVCMKILPVGLMGLIIAAMLSATLSTLGSEYNTLSGVLTRDFYKRIVNPGASEQREIVFGRIATVLIGAITMFLAILLNSLQGLTLMDIMFRFFSAFGPPIMIPLIAGLLSRKFTARGVIWGILAGTLTGVLLIIVNIVLVQKYADLMASNPRVDFWLRSGWNSAATMLNIAMTFAGMWLGSVIADRPADEQKRVEGFFADLDRPFELEDGDGKPKRSPFGIIGFTLLAFGCAIILISLLVLLAYHDRRAFLLDFVVGLFIALLGYALTLVSKRQSEGNA